MKCKSILDFFRSGPFLWPSKDTKVLSCVTRVKNVHKYFRGWLMSTAAIKRGGPLYWRPPNPPQRPGSLRWLPNFLHWPKRRTPPVCVSAPWSALGLSSSRPPAAAPTCGSLVQRTPRWRRARWISPWKPNRRKTWWDILWRILRVWNVSAGWMKTVGSLC